VKLKHHSILTTGYWLLATGYCFLFVLAAQVSAATLARPTSVAVLDFGDTATGRRMADRVSQALSANGALLLTDREEGRAAARGAGYAGSLNLTLEEARDLGAAIGADFYITGDAQTLRRSPSKSPVYYEAYASIFIVSARSGRLIMWDRPSFERGTPEEAERALQAELAQRAAARYSALINAAAESEREERAVSTAHGVPLIEEVPAEDSPDARGLRPPAPYRRLRPAYPETAERAEAEATVDVLVDIDADGEVARVEVVRWAGFGLDEECVNTIRRMHFRPAMRDGQVVPMRALLRYNFRRPTMK
jgi:TonB family protein